MGKHWFTNGIIQVQKETCPDGFWRGRLPVSDETRKKHSENNAWHVMTDEQKEARAKKISSTISSRTEEEKRLYSETLSQARKGKGLNIEPWNKGKKGLQKAWNKGLSQTAETKAKIHATWQQKSIEEKAVIEAKRRSSREYSEPWNKGISTGEWSEEAKKEILAKQYKTKKKNNSFNSSAGENRFYKRLLTICTEDDIVYQYNTDARYPFNCDFYIKSKDLFIELNYNWTHGSKLFESTEQDLQKLTKWQEKALTSNYYKNAIETWTKRDVTKIMTAKENNLKYLVYYSEADTVNLEDDIKKF